MLKNIIHDESFLKIPSTDLKQDELYVVSDLIDTLNFHKDNCVGMAANMIGYSKNAIVILLNNKKILPMINPKIISKSEPYFTEEGCLSLDGTRNTIRFKNIIVEYCDEKFNKKTKPFKDFEAQIIQHEVDHLFGKII